MLEQANLNCESNDCMRHIIFDVRSNYKHITGILSVRVVISIYHGLSSMSLFIRCSLLEIAWEKDDEQG